MIKNIMYLSITAFVLFKLFQGQDIHQIEARVLRTYQGAVAGFQDGESEVKAIAKPTPAPVAVPVPVAEVVAPVAGEVAGCTENCEGEEPAVADATTTATEVKPDSPTVVTLPAPDAATPVAATNGQ